MKNEWIEIVYDALMNKKTNLQKIIMNEPFIMKIVHKRTQHEYVFVLMLHYLYMSIKVVEAMFRASTLLYYGNRK